MSVLVPLRCVTGVLRAATPCTDSVAMMSAGAEVARSRDAIGAPYPSLPVAAGTARVASPPHICVPRNAGVRLGSPNGGGWQKGIDPDRPPGSAIDSEGSVIPSVPMSVPMLAMDGSMDTMEGALERSKWEESGAWEPVSPSTEVSGTSGSHVFSYVSHGMPCAATLPCITGKAASLPTNTVQNTFLAITLTP